MAKVELLPRKVFEFTLENGNVIKGQFGLWSSKRFADKKGLSLIELLDLRNAEKLSLDDICLMLLCAVEYVHRQDKTIKGPFPYNDMDACEWIEELGGLEGADFIKVMGHASTELKEDAPPADTDEEKKSL